MFPSVDVSLKSEGSLSIREGVSLFLYNLPSESVTFSLLGQNIKIPDQKQIQEGKSLFSAESFEGNCPSWWGKHGRPK